MTRTKGHANLNARFKTKAMRSGWIPTELFCPFCGKQYDLHDGKKYTNRGVQMRAGMNGNNLYRCSVCDEAFYLDVKEHGE